MKNTKLLLGPLVGGLTHNSVKIWGRASGAATLHVWLLDGGQVTQVDKTRVDGKTGFAGVVEIKDLQPEAWYRYALTLSNEKPPAASFGIEDPEQAAWLEARMTPHPFSTYVTPIGLSAPPGARLPATYVRCTDPPYTALDWAEARARALGWPVETIATGHDCMVSAPQETADLLERLAG